MKIPRGLSIAAFVWTIAAAVFLCAGHAIAAPVTEGCLHATDKEGRDLGMCPLKHTEVAAEISGYIARVTVTQCFGNPFQEPIEAVYAFPLSDRGAVDAMTMTVGDRTICGIIKEREEARRIYEAARNAGQAAALLDQERPNIFTQSVANILPGNEIRITISYVEYLKNEDGQYEFAFPMVVGPRYVPGCPTGASGTDQVPDAGRIAPPVTPEGTRAGHDISLTVHVDAGMPIQDIQSVLHTVDIEQPAPSQATVRLAEKNEIPNRDFVLHYRVAASEIGDAVLTHVGAKGGFFTLVLEPPERVAPKQVTPKEMIFVIDCSGSMRGFPIGKAKETMRLCIEAMNPDDSFNLVSFSGGVGYCFQQPVPNTAENRTRALEYLAGLEGGGGTEMMSAICAALGNQDDPERLRIVCFMTDGFIGNDMAILDAVQKNAHTARVFAFGIGNGVNRFLLEGMARAGRGAAEIVTLESGADEAAARFHERVHSPILTDITVDFGDLPVEDVYPDPETMPDLFAASPLALTGRFTGPAEGTVTVRGRTAQGPFERAVHVLLPKDEPAHDVLAPLWARARVAWLMEQDWLGAQQGQPDPSIKAAVTQLGLDFGLVTPYTSFVAVEERVINENGKPKTVQVPVEMTDGVSYEGVFGESPAIPQACAAPARASAAGIGRAVAEVKSLGYLGAAYTATSQDAIRAAALKPEARRQSEQTPDTSIQAGGKETSKLDTRLRGLKAKLVNANYAEGPVKVVDGWVKVCVELTDDGEETLDALRALHVRIISTVRSRMRVLAMVRVEDLEAVAQLAGVKRVVPPA
jgi:Ca-activated chloride channel family protein